MSKETVKNSEITILNGLKKASKSSRSKSSTNYLVRINPKRSRDAKRLAWNIRTPYHVAWLRLVASGTVLKVHLKRREKENDPKALWCVHQNYDENGVMMCLAHLAKARVSDCNYKDLEERNRAEYPCSDYRAV